LLLGALAILALAPPAALASAEHPKLVVGGEEAKSPSAPKVVIDWGQIQLRNRALGSVECVNLTLAKNFDNTEPGGGEGTEIIRAYGEVLGWSAASYTNASGLEPSTSCRFSLGLVAWLTAEPPPHVTTEVADSIEGAPTERLVVQGNFGSTATHREPPSLPWLEESEGTENEAHVKTFFVKTGIAAAASERAEVEAEEAGAGVPTERRTGCYRFPPFTEIVREPGFAATRETEPLHRPAPQGCVKVTLVVPQVGFEMPFEGTLEPEVVNGTKSGLAPSSGSFKGGLIGPESEVPSERSLERNERALSSLAGPAFIKSITPIKEIGYLHEELLTLK
jgi:hypothetical protein